jgi:hypothetical protein
MTVPMDCPMGVGGGDRHVPKVKDRIALVAAGILALSLAACGGFGLQPAPTIALVVPQPSAVDLERFAPGGVAASSTADMKEGAPLPCGGTRQSRLADATIVKIPNSLSQVSVLRYEFGSADDAAAYFDALRAQVALVSNEQCTPAGLGSGVPSAVSLFAFAGSPQADTTGTTAYPSGPYAGGFQYNVARYLEQGRDVYVIRVDREYAYADIALEDGVQNAMTTRTASASSIGGATSPAGYLEGVLRQGTFGCCTIKTPPVGPIGPWAESQDMNCPELVANGTVYSINI